MTHKISRFCDGLIEAAWIAAAIITPLFFNIFSFRIFEPDKITILRCLAILILAAWVIKVVVLAVQPPNPKRTIEPSPSLQTGDLSKKLIEFLKLPLIAPLLFPGDRNIPGNNIFGYPSRQPMGILPALTRKHNFPFVCCNFRGLARKPASASSGRAVIYRDHPDELAGQPVWDFAALWIGSDSMGNGCLTPCLRQPGKRDLPGCLSGHGFSAYRSAIAGFHPNNSQVKS